MRISNFFFNTWIIFILNTLNFYGGACGVNGGARGVMVIVEGIGHNDTSSNPGRDWLHFTLH